MSMTSTRPYLLRAFYEWIVDNEFTPYVVIRTDLPNVKVPNQYIEDDKIVLNISPYATDKLNISNEAVEFHASFSGLVTEIYAPIASVIAIYANENGRGMVFGEEEDDGDDTPPSDDDSGKGRPHLKVVK